MIIVVVNILIVIVISIRINSETIPMQRTKMSKSWTNVGLYWQ
jgi:hypothetical protein